MNQNGNILFLILIAVALFAALSYAVTSSNRTNEGGLQRDKARLIASRIIQYGNELENQINRLMVINGCSDTQISFERRPFNGSDSLYTNPNAPADYRCHVFHPNNGNIIFFKELELSNYVNGISFQSTRATPGVGSDCASAECTDLRMTIRITGNPPSAQELESGSILCEEIQNILKQDELLIFGDDTTSPLFAGSYGASGSLNNVFGLRSFCGRTSSNGPYSYNHVLIAR